MEFTCKISRVAVPSQEKNYYKKTKMFTSSNITDQFNYEMWSEFLEEALRRSGTAPK